MQVIIQFFFFNDSINSAFNVMQELKAKTHYNSYVYYIEQFFGAPTISKWTITGLQYYTLTFTINNLKIDNMFP